MTWTPSKRATEAAAIRIVNACAERCGTPTWAEYPLEEKAVVIILAHEGLIAAHEAEMEQQQ